MAEAKGDINDSHKDSASVSHGLSIMEHDPKNAAQLIAHANSQFKRSSSLDTGTAHDLYGKKESGGDWLAVAGDIAKGALKEVTENPLHVVAEAGVGLAVGAAAALVAPEIALGVGVAATVAVVEANGGFKKVGKDLLEGAEHIVHDANVVAHSSQYSAQENAAASKGLEKAGAVGTDVAAGMAGGVAGSLLAAPAKELATSMASRLLKAPEVVLPVPEGAERGALSAALTDAVVDGARDTAKVTGKIVASSDSAKDSALTNGKITIDNATSGGSHHVDVNRAVVTNPDGQEHQVFFHSNEMTPELTASRIAKEQDAYMLNKIIGFENSYPESHAISVSLKGATREGWVQEASGAPLEQELRRRAVAQFGTTLNMDKDVPAMFEADQQLKEQVVNAVAERVAYGDEDISARNIGITSSGKGSIVRNFDMGEAFGGEQTPTLTSHTPDLASIGLQNAVSGQAIPEATQRAFSNFLTRYDTPDGMSQLRARGLSTERIDGVLGRVRWMVEHGRLPGADPAINEPDNISWWRAAEPLRAKRK